MKLLYLTPRPPYPPLKGDQLVAYQRLRHLSRRHEISLVSLIAGPEERTAGAELAPLCESVELVELRAWRSVLNVAAGAPTSRLPLQVLYYRSAAFRRAIERTLAGRRFDLVHAFFHRTAPYAAGLPLPSVLDVMDSMVLRMERNLEVERGPMRLVYREELRRMRPYERALAGSFDELIVVSDQDADYLEGSVTVVQNGVDHELFAPRPELRTPGTIVFSGVMRYRPNVHAATWFAERCLPRVRRAVPEATLTIAGVRPAREVRALGRLPGVRVTGWTESMAAELNRASVAVAPMRSGAGIQNKILEAMACGLPVVTTSIGLGGPRARPGEELVVADDEESFAEAVAGLLRSPERARELGRRGREFVLAEHDWERAADRVDEVYARVLRTS